MLNQKQQPINKNIKEKLDNVIGIEYAEKGTGGFEVHGYLSQLNFQEHGCQVITFHPNPSKSEIFNNFKQKLYLLLAKHIFAKPIYIEEENRNNLKKSIQKNTNYLVPSIVQFTMWKLQAYLWSVQNYVLICLKFKDVFKIEVNGVVIGDQIVAHSVRSSKKYPSRLRLDWNFFIALVSCYSTCQWAKFLIKSKHINTFLISHNTYSLSMFNRMAIAFKKQYLFLQFPFPVFVTSRTKYPTHPFILPINQLPNLSLKEKELADEYMKKRTSSGKSVLSYMKTSAYSEEKLNWNPLRVTEEAINVCIFLHSFGDALFLFGHDSFNDLWDWTTFTVDSLLQVSHKKSLNILIKPHPNVFQRKDCLSDVFEKDFATYSKLQEAYHSYSSISFIPASTSNIALSKLNNFIGITHHGNVAPELAYLGKPVIASNHGPWKHSNQFLMTWSDRTEYKQCLNKIDTALDFIPNQQEFLKFAFYYYIKFSGVLLSYKGIVQYLDKVYSDKYNLSIESKQKISNLLKVIKSDSDILSEGIRLVDLYLQQALNNDSFLKNHIG